MKLVKQLLKEAGADTDKTFTVALSFGGYFRSVKKVEVYMPQKIVLAMAKKRVTVIGENLVIDKYFQQDLFIKGNITGVNVE